VIVRCGEGRLEGEVGFVILGPRCSQFVHCLHRFGYFDPLPLSQMEVVVHTDSKQNLASRAGHHDSYVIEDVPGTKGRRQPRSRKRS
jgi:hypothetical protein